MSLWRCGRAFVWLLSVTVASFHCMRADEFGQTNLVSDMPGVAHNTDPNLKNPWGVSFVAGSPFWVSNQVTGNSTLYNASGVPQGLVVTIPGGGPTGQVFNTTTGFVEADGSKAFFIFATLGGTIAAWNGGNGTTATQVASTAGAAYTGLALASSGTNNFLYAANASQGRIDVFNSAFKPATLTGSFADPNLPVGYTPYNIQAIGGNLYVEYSQGFNTGLGLGIVDKFSADGVLLQRLVTGGQLDAPWGIALAPAGFGNFGGDLLIGNLGNGEINAFDSSSGAFVGTLTGTDGKPLVNNGLWALSFRSAPGFNSDTLYFTAGSNNQKDGLFGAIQPVPEPATFLIGALGLGAILALKRRLG